MWRATAAVPVLLCSQRHEPVAPAPPLVVLGPALVAVAPVQRREPALPALLPTALLLRLHAPVSPPIEPAAPATAPVALGPALVAVALAPRLWPARPSRRLTALRGLAFPPPRDAAPQPLDPL